MTIPGHLEAPDFNASQQEQDAKTRGRLIRAAVQVFDKKGYDAASVREIVELAGVTKPALYYHFGSKEGVLKAILTEGQRQFETLTARALARPGSARERVLALCEDLYGMFGENLSFVRVTHAVFLGPTDIAPDFDFAVYERSVISAVEQIVKDAQAHEEVAATSAEDVALAVLGVVASAAGRQLHARMEPISMARLRRLLNLVLDGVLKDSTNARSAGEERQ